MSAHNDHAEWSHLSAWACAQAQAGIVLHQWDADDQSAEVLATSAEPPEGAGRGLRTFWPIWRRAMLGRCLKLGVPWEMLTAACKVQDWEAEPGAPPLVAEGCQHCRRLADRAAVLDEIAELVHEEAAMTTARLERARAVIRRLVGDIYTLDALDYGRAEGEAVGAWIADFWARVDAVAEVHGVLNRNDRRGRARSPGG